MGCNTMKTLGIITARSGSKGLKDKNIRLLNGKELIAYTIEAAIESECFDEVMVSTDSEKYANISLKYGAKVPFLRSKEAASDVASTRDVILEVTHNYKKMGKIFDRFMILQPTSPLRTLESIRGAFKVYDDMDADGIVSVCEAEHSPLWCNTLPKNKSLKGFLKVESDTRRQSLDTYYRLNGAIYLYDTMYYINNEDSYGERVYAYIMDALESIDIDTIVDFYVAEALMARKTDFRYNF